jgi:hypothetical protein
MEPMHRLEEDEMLWTKPSIRPIETALHDIQDSMRNKAPVPPVKILG